MVPYLALPLLLLQAKGGLSPGSSASLEQPATAAISPSVLRLSPNGKHSAKALLHIPIDPPVKLTSATFVDKGTAPEITFAFANTLDEGSNTFAYFIADATGVPLDPFSMQRNGALTVG